MKDHLSDKVDEFDRRRVKHKKNENILKFLYYAFGYVMIILNYFITTDIFDIQAIKILTIMNAILTTFLTFGKIETKINQHHSAASYLSDYVIDLNSFILSKPSDSDILRFFELMEEKEKLTNSITPDLCF